MKSNLKADGTWINWKPGRKQADVSDRYNYDLYAVCNHYGNMQGGHYTGELNLAMVIQMATTQVSYVVEPGRGDTGSNYTGELCR